MKLAITIAEQAPMTSPFVLRGALDASIRAAGDLGYDGVELHSADPADLDLGAIRQAVRQSGVGIAAFGTGMATLRDGIALTHDDEAIRAAAIARLGAFIDLGAEFGGVVILGLIKGLLRNAASADAFHARLEQALSRLLPQAERRGVTLVLEAQNRYEGDVFNTAAETLAYVGRFGSDRLKVHLDTFHMNIEEVDLPAVLRETGAALGHLHVADSNRRYPGAGHIDFPALVAPLREIGYRGALSLECLPLPDPRGAAKGAIATLAPLLGR